MANAFKLIVAIIVIASFGIWVYAYGFVEAEQQDLWDDPQLGVAAQTICTSAKDDIDAMPGALVATDGADRAQQITDSTARLTTMVDELEALEPQTENDQYMHEGWISNWRTVIEDRYRYADAIAADENAQYLQTDIGGVERLDRRLTRFADVNQMYACGAPTDV